MTNKIELSVEGFHSPDFDMATQTVCDLADVYFLVEFEVGVAGGRGKDVFSVLIATPEALRRHASGVIICSRATMVVSEFLWGDVRSALLQTIRECAGASWSESVLKLQRYFHWEYEDYRFS